MGRVIKAEEFFSTPLEVIECRVYRGPHLHSNKPMIRIQVNLGALEEWPTNKLPGFTDRLLELLPSLAEHTCSTGEAGGFVERLREGTWMGHVIEHVAIELQYRMGIKVTRGKTRSVAGRPGYYNIMYHYLYEEAGLCAGRAALDLVASLLQSPFTPFKGTEKVCLFTSGDPFNLEVALSEIKRLAQLEKFGPTTGAIVEEAEHRNIPWFKIDDDSLIQLGTGRYRKLVCAAITSATSCIAVEIASDKELTKKLLSKAGIPVPEGQLAQTMEDTLKIVEEIGFPLVIKPSDGNHGRGVSTNIGKINEVNEAFTLAKQHSSAVIVEQYLKGRDYRVLVINGEVTAVAERVPAHVIGNGIDSIKTLIETLNADPRRGDGHDEIMTRVEIGDSLHAWLARCGLSLDIIPQNNQYIVLAATANLSTGGTAIDCTDEIHPDNAMIARRAALTIGLDVAGIDLIVPDIRRSWRETGGGIVEVNASPGLRMHLHPAEGPARNVAKQVLSSLFPEGEKTHIPVIAITGTNGKSTTTRMVAHILRQTGMNIGFTSTSGVFINDECLWKGDASGPKSARMLLQDPTIDVAILETARGGILREGLGVKHVDVGVVLNITEDHLGIGGIETLEDLAEVKSVVVQAVIPGGISILNADNPFTCALAKNTGGNICYFSMTSGKGSMLRNHISHGGMAVIREVMAGKAHIVYYTKGHRIPIIAIDDIPATYQGMAAFNVENAMAAAAISIGLGANIQAIRTALASFSSSFEQNPGRFNLYDGHGFRVIMDYAHNPAALTAFYAMIHEMGDSYDRVIGNVSVPGDRRDEDIREASRIACKELDIVVFSEEPDMRGRISGEIHALLNEGALSAGYSKDRIICVRQEIEAIETCLKLAQPGDLVILVSSHPEDAWKQMLAFKPHFAKRREQESLQEYVAYA